MTEAFVMVAEAEATRVSTADANPWPVSPRASLPVAGLALLTACGGGRGSPPSAFFDRAQATEAPGLLVAGKADREAPAAVGRTGQLPDATALMDWAQDQYPQYFPGRKPDQRFDPYVYRHYPETGNYLGVAGSDVYVLGPITGDVLRRVGALADFAENVHGDVRPIDPADAVAARFLQQCQFSSTPEEIAAVRAMGIEALLAEQMIAPRGLTGVQWLDRRGCYSANGRNQFHLMDLAGVWMGWNQIMTAPDAVRTRAVLALSEYFVISGVDLPAAWWPCYSMAGYWDLLSAYAFGSFRALLEAITLNYAMGSYLNTLDNQKEDAAGRQPDENYAREVMQLFTIGLYELNIDGSPRLDARGEPIEIYTNTDVTNLARVFTGYVGDDDGVQVPIPDSVHATIDSRAQNLRPMRFEASRHSTLECRFLGTVIPAGTAGPAALRIALDRLFNHPNVGPFFARQMIQRLVTSNPSPAYVGRVAAVFNDNGRGVRGDLHAVFSAIWLDAEARGAGSTDASRIGKLREPILRIAQWGRSFASLAVRSRWDLDLFWRVGPTQTLNQVLLRSPTVFNHFRPGYVPPLTAMATNAWAAPEFQLVDETSVAIYLNWLQAAIRVGLDANVNDEIWDLQGRVVGPLKESVPAEYVIEQALAPYAGALVHHLNLVLCAGQLPADVQRLMIDALNATPIDANSSAGAKLDRIVAAVLMTMAAPEYLVQH